METRDNVSQDFEKEGAYVIMTKIVNCDEFILILHGNMYYAPQFRLLAV